MTLAELLARAGLDAGDGLDVAITGVVEDSRAVEPGHLFVAIRGVHDDGSRYAEEAVARGAAAVVAAADRPTELASGVPWIRVADDRRALADLAAAYHGGPGEQLELTAITGSKGKTTTSFLCAAIAETTGPTALFGTILSRIGDLERPQRLTTPSAASLQRLLREAVDAGMRAAVIEVSSHAVSQDRVHPLRFAYGLFTNLFPDHLDYHGDVDDYFAAKRRLFCGERACRTAVVGIDDEHGRRLAAERPDAVTFGAAEGATVVRLQSASDRDGVRVRLRLPQGELAITSRLLGRHNAANLTAAAAYGVARGVEPEAIAMALARVEAIPGRMERVDAGQPFLCLVDFSHTGPALTAALAAAREWTRGRVIVVVGAGGDRPTARRGELGRAAAAGADLAFLTSDNPRTEDPVAIVGAVEAAYDDAGGRDKRVVVDRAEAIAAAVATADADDMILVAGKGHERTQIVGTQKLPFDDREVLRSALSEHGWIG